MERNSGIVAVYRRHDYLRRNCVKRKRAATTTTVTTLHEEKC